MWYPKYKVIRVAGVRLDETGKSIPKRKRIRNENCNLRVQARVPGQNAWNKQTLCQPQGEGSKSSRQKG